jgi:Domain of unknown function (DUF202)
VTTARGEPSDAAGGAQVERTALAWNRLSFAVAANGGLLMRAGFTHDLLVLDIAGSAAVVAALGIWSLSLYRYAAIAGSRASYLFLRTRVSAMVLTSLIGLLSILNLTVVLFAR